MAATTKNLIMPKVKDGAEGWVQKYDVKAAEEIYIGTFVGWDTSEDALANCPASAANEFVGLAKERVTGGSADGSVTAEVLVGAVVELTLSSVDETNLGDLVYADDNQTLSTTSTSNTLVGRIVGIITGEANKCLVKLKEPFYPIVDTT